MDSKGNKREASFLPEYVEEFDLSIGSEQMPDKSKFKSKSGREHVITVEADHDEVKGGKPERRRKSGSRSSSQMRNQLQRRRDDSRSHIVGMSSVMDTVNECISQVMKVINRLGSFANEHKLLCKRTSGIVSEPCPELRQIAEVMENIICVTEATFPPAHRLCQAAIGFYLTEDFIRDSHKDSSFDYFTQGRIRVPSQSSNQSTLKKIKSCVNMAAMVCSKWTKIANSKATVIKRRPEKSLQELCEIMSTLRTSIQNLYNAAVGSVHLFDLLVYLSPEAKASLLDFLNSLESVQRAELLEDITSLRRLIDYIPLIFEKLTWKCYAIHSLAGGKPIHAKSILPKAMTPESNNSSGTSSTTSSKQSLEAIGARGGHQHLNGNFDQNGNEIFEADLYEKEQEDMNCGYKRRTSSSKLKFKLENTKDEVMLNRKRSSSGSKNNKNKGSKGHNELDLKDSSSSNLGLGIDLGSTKILNTNRKSGKNYNHHHRNEKKNLKDFN